MAALETNNFCFGGGTEITVLANAEILLEVADTVASTTLFEGWLGSIADRADDWLGGGWGGDGGRYDWLGGRSQGFGAVEGVHFCPGVRADDTVTGSSAGSTTRTGDVVGELEFLNGKFGGRPKITVDGYAGGSGSVAEGVLQVSNAGAGRAGPEHSLAGTGIRVFIWNLGVAGHQVVGTADGGRQDDKRHDKMVRETAGIKVFKALHIGFYFLFCFWDSD